jgi:RNA polymerase sigma factor (sigma-70 family)
MPYECFYTLPRQIEDRHIIWQIDKRLRSRIEFLREQIDSLGVFEGETLESKIARYLFEQLQQYPQESLLKKHWLSFLLRRCEKTAIAILRLIPISSHSQLFSDLFQMGVEIVNDPVQFFGNFDEERFNLNYWYPTLKRFADSKIKHFLFPRVRELTGFTTLGLTNLGLVSRASRKQINDALKSSKSQEIVSQYLLAWQCFQEVRKSGQLEVRKFQREHFQKIADRYNQFQKQLASSQTRPINGETIRNWLEEIGVAIRRLLEPSFISLNCLVGEGEEIALIDTIPSNLISDEVLTDYGEINQAQIASIKFISNLLSRLEEIEKRQILLLRYGLQLTQTEIAKELQKNQSTIQRKLNSLHQNILKQLWDWIGLNLEIDPTPEGMKEIEAVLSQYYSDQIDRITIEAIQSLEVRSQKLLKLFYVARKTRAEIIEKIRVSEAEIEILQDAIAQKLYDWITKRIEAEIQLQFHSQVVKECIPVLVESRLPTVLQLDKD